LYLGDIATCNGETALPKIHIEVPALLRQKLGVKAEYLQKDYSAYVVGLIENDTADIVIPEQYRAKA
jgi:hypothetical protein